MHAADQFDAFHALHTNKSIQTEDISARFGAARLRNLLRYRR
jgi:hypothetical protein